MGDKAGQPIKLSVGGRHLDITTYVIKLLENKTAPKICIIVLLLHIYYTYTLVKENRQNIYQCGPLFIFQGSALTLVISYMVSSSAILELIRKHFSYQWTNDILGKGCMKEIKRERRNAYIRLTLLVMNSVAATVVLAWALFHSLTSKEHKIFISIMLFSYVSYWYGPIQISFFGMYILLELKYQIYSFNDQVQKMINDLKHTPVYFVDNKCFQETTRKRLRTLVGQHRIIKSLSRKGKSLIFTQLTVYFVIGISTSTAAVYGLFTSEGDFRRLSGYILLCLLIVIFANSVSAMGQGLIDKSEETYQIALNLPWYTWNTENRKQFLIFLMSCKEPIAFRGATVVLDNEIFVKFMKIIYSAATFVYQVKGRNALRN